MNLTYIREQLSKKIPGEYELFGTYPKYFANLEYSFFRIKPSRTYFEFLHPSYLLLQFVIKY